MTLDTRDDRTLFFDLLPLSFTASTGLTVRLKLFTVPGQVIHNATRRLVLSGADGVVFIADSQKSETKANAEAFVNLKQNMKENGLDTSKIPLLIQFNKRDLPDIRSDQEIDVLAKRGKEPVYKAVATRGVGVLETFLGLVRGTWQQLEREHQLKEKFQLAPEQVITTLVEKLGLRDSKAPQEGGAAP